MGDLHEDNASARNSSFCPDSTVNILLRMLLAHIFTLGHTCDIGRHKTLMIDIFSHSAPGSYIQSVGHFENPALFHSSNLDRNAVL